MKQRKVATNTSEYRQRIINEVAKHPEGITPKYIALYTQIKHSYVRTLITKIPEIEQVPEIRGLYRSVVKEGHGGIFSYNFHNLLLTVYLPNYQKETVQTTLSCDFSNSEFMIAKTSKTATLRISTPKIDGTDYPINVSSITLAFALFKSLIKQHADTEIQMKDVTVSSIEFNKDYENLRLDGVNTITMENLTEQFKIYNKKDKLRTEHKLTVPMNAEELIKLLGIRL